jgi:hypothetical protein
VKEEIRLEVEVKEREARTEEEGELEEGWTQQANPADEIIRISAFDRQQTGAKNW